MKQKGEAFSEFEMNFETVVEKILYNDQNRKRWKKGMENGRYHRQLKGILAPFQTMTQAQLKDFNLYFIGQSHLDAAWLWPVVDTKLRAYKTFYKAVEHLEQFPFLTFSQTSPQYFQWIKAYDPKLWEKVKKLVELGKIEPTGGMWIEPTLDECWGESIVRQRLYGQLFNLREFGKIPEIESLLDVFGFPYSLPQILVKSGAKAFWTTKCTWNDVNMWPLANYMWQGIDGSQIFTHHFKFNLMALLDLKLYKKLGRKPKSEFNQTRLTSHNSNNEIELTMSNERVKDLGIFFGLGDGARGPLEIEIYLFQLLAQLGYGKFTSSQRYFEILQEKVGKDYLVWDDEMYLEFHRACKTTVNEIKHYNRRAELWAYAAETLLTLSNLEHPNSTTFEKERVFEIWRKILFNQFHDILPGSSIPDVYELAVKEQKAAIQDSKDIIESILAKIPTEITENEILVFNPFSWERSEYVKYKDEILYIENIPPLSIQKVKESDVKVTPAKINTIYESDEDFFIENEFFTAKIRKSSGTLISLYYKEQQQEMITTSGTTRHEGSGLRIFKELNPGMFPAWNLDRSYPSHKIPVKPISVAKKTTLDKSCTGMPCITTSFKFLNSSAEVTFYALPYDPILHLHIQTDLQDKKILVKYFIPINLKTEDVVAEIPYASISRKRIPHTEMEKSKWEMPMQKWIDISDSTHGLTILNNNRYGFRATPKGVYLTLTRSAKFSTPGFYSTYRKIPTKKMPKFTDLMQFEYDFGLWPHKGTWKDAKSWQKAYDFNLPLITKESLSQSEIPITFPILKKGFLQFSSPNIIIGSIKPSEWCGKEFEVIPQTKDWTWDSKSIILRCVEQKGEDTQTLISISSELKVHRIEEVDLLERPIGKPLPLSENGAALHFTRFEIKTLRILFK